MAHDLGQVDLTDLDAFAGGFPHDIFRLHRDQAPVWWHEPTAHTPNGEGFWSVATYDEVLHVLRDPVTYSSETGGDRPYGGTIIQDLPVAGVVLNMMDDPRHARIRRLVTRGLTPAAVRGLEDELRRRMRHLLDLGRRGVRLPRRRGRRAPMQASASCSACPRLPATSCSTRWGTSSTFPTSPTSSP